MSFPNVKKYVKGDDNWFDGLTTVVNRILMGKTSNVHTVTLSMTTGSASTVVHLSSGQVGPDTHVGLEPANANAAAAMGAGTLYVSARDPVNNTITITHPVDTSNTRSFRFTLTG